MGVPPVDEAALACPAGLLPCPPARTPRSGTGSTWAWSPSSLFPPIPQGFPEEILAPFERAHRAGGAWATRPASGTAIIDELGRSTSQTGWPIVYTSADSVFQIAAHVDVVPLELLYEWCETARELLTGAARGGAGHRPALRRSPGAFVRTKDRRDFSLAPPAPTYLDLLQEAGVPVLALGQDQRDLRWARE